MKEKKRNLIRGIDECKSSVRVRIHPYVKLHTRGILAFSRRFMLVKKAGDIFPAR
jgi:hypothetical protein